MIHDQDDSDDYREEMYERFHENDEPDDDGSYGLSAAERNQ